MPDLVLSCIEPPFGTVEVRPSNQTEPEDGFVAGRQYAPKVRRHRIHATGVPVQFWAEAIAQIRNAHGGAVRLTFVPPRGGASQMVRVVSPVRRIDTGAGICSFSFEVEEAR